MEKYNKTNLRIEIHSQKKVLKNQLEPLTNFANSLNPLKGVREFIIEDGFCHGIEFEIETNFSKSDILYFIVFYLSNLLDLEMPLIKDYYYSTKLDGFTVNIL